jgi:hypothetical protein
MDPPTLSRGAREAKHVSGQMQSYIRPLREGIVYLRALMKSALPLLNNASTSRVVSTFRVWGSWSDRSCHQRAHTSHRAVGCLNLLALTSSIIVKPCSPAARLTPVAYPVVSTHGLSSRVHRRHHPSSAMPTRSVHSCSPPPLPSGSTLDDRATPVSIGCDCPCAASPSAASPVHRGSTAYASSYHPAC